MSVLPTVRDQITQAALREATRRERTPRPRRRRTGARFSVSGVVLVGTLLATIVIAVTAITSLHGRVNTTGPRTAARSTGLVAQLAVLQRPQQPTDVLPPHADLGSFSKLPVIPSLTRLIATLPGTKLYLVVTKPWNTAWSRNLGDQVTILDINTHHVTWSQPIPAVDLNDPSQVSMLGAPPNSWPHGLAGMYNVEIVPDGVSSVQWIFDKANGDLLQAVQPSVANNIAFAPATSATIPVLALAHVNWYAANGNAVPTSIAALHRATARSDARARENAIRNYRRHPSQAAPELLDNFKIFSIQSQTGVHVGGGLTILHPTLSALPKAILTNVPSPGFAPSIGLDLNQIREVIAESGDELFVFPGTTGICLTVVDFSPLSGLRSGSRSTCSFPLDEATSGLSMTGGSYGHGTETVGVVPNGRKSVRVRISPGVYRTVTPIDGIYIVNVATPNLPHVITTPASTSP